MVQKKSILKTLNVIKWLIIGAAMVYAFGIAGRSDFEDAVLQEMKNNGTYYTMLQEHPSWSESKMVDVYMEKKK